ncbi:MAG: cyclodeaminase/cyclohydrolase family protein [Candidatus Saelkia tenebricola]|nr:cyclodeaminase/cyclohydrolase family protein [Candidatus Saelkia tenebricola]
MDSLENLSLRQYLDNLAQKSPAPGGGSAAAVVVSVAVALYKMCFSYSKKNFDAVEFKDLTAQINALLDSAVSFIQKDKDVYSNLVEILKDKSRGDEIQSAYKNAAMVPLEIINICRKMMDVILINISKIELVFLSDLKSSVNFLKSGFKSAEYFIDANLKCLSLEDLEFFENFKEREIEYLKSEFKRVEKEIENGS